MKRLELLQVLLCLTDRQLYRDGVGQWITIFTFSSLYQNWCDRIYNLKFIINIDINKYVEKIWLLVTAQFTLSLLTIIFVACKEKVLTQAGGTRVKQRAVYE